MEAKLTETALQRFEDRVWGIVEVTDDLAARKGKLEAAVEAYASERELEILVEIDELEAFEGEPVDVIVADHRIRELKVELRTLYATGGRG